jgi:hypothetical protein
MMTVAQRFRPVATGLVVVPDRILPSWPSTAGTRRGHSQRAVTQSDLASADGFETQFPGLVAAGRPVLIVALAFRAADLEHIQRLHPGGVLTTYTDTDDRPSCLTYELAATNEVLQPPTR